jgi:hypothetical protein
MQETVCTASCEPVARRAFPTKQHIFGIIRGSCDHRRTPYPGDIMKMVKKILLWTVVAFIVYTIIVSPSQAAHIFQGAWNLVVLAAKNIAAFFNNILTHN